MEKPVYYKNENVGSINIANEGLFTVLRCDCRFFDEILRLYGAGEDYYPIGILVPEDDRMILEKRFSKNDLQRIPLYECSGFELFGAGEKPMKDEPEKKQEVIKNSEPDIEREAVSEQSSIWSETNDPAALFADPELMEAASVIRGGMVAKDGNTQLLAIPISGDSPFPMMPVFRYGSSAMVQGKCCIVFRIENGYLI